MIDKLISALLMLDGNETINLSKDNQNAFKNLIVQISRIKYGVRWHEYDRDCSCQPEWRIMTLLTDVEFKEFLERKKVLEDIETLLDKPINKNMTVWGDSNE